MNRKIIGVTVGSPLPKSNLMQTDPTKGDYVKGRKEFLEEINSGSNVTIDSVTPDKVIFPDGATTTYAIGNVKLSNGMGTLVKPGGTLEDFFNVFVDEKNPTTTKPSISLTFPNAGQYEVGSYVPITYEATFKKGSYSYGPDTGITVSTSEGVYSTGWEITDTEGNGSGSTSNGFGDYKLQVEDDTNYKITAKVYHTEGSIPKTNTGNDYPAGKIAANSADPVTSSAITGYRRTFYGTFESKDTLDSSKIRKLTGKSNKALKNGDSFTVTVPLKAMQVVIAYPATLRDLTAVKDVNGMGAEIVQSFEKSVVTVAGDNEYEPIDYKVFVLPFGEPNDAANTFNVTI